ncbi:hypothetical protein HYX04_01250 [Candidatus Woesearchaeota archaeon]|nr:hypothetical protein [Candidatus Woesearchaeota archaeon]
MVWFARWRPKFRKVVACTMIISALASAGSSNRELMFYDQAKAAYSEILELDQVLKENEEAVKKVYELMIDAANMKTLAEKLSKEGKAEESKQEYRNLLKKYEQIVEILTLPSKRGTHIALAKNDIIIIKRKLERNKFFDQNRVDIMMMEGNIHSAWVEVDRLTKSVSNDMQEVERILGIIE